MEQEPKQEILTKQELHESLGKALESGDNETALRLLDALKDELEKEVVESAEDAGREIEAPETPESAESLTAERLAFEIGDLTGTEITIFGTGRGLTIPLSVVMHGQGTRDFTRVNKEVREEYERGRTSETMQVGLFLHKKGGLKTVDYVKKSRDAFGRAGFKGIEVIFPADDGGLASRAAEDELMLQEAVTIIWNQLGEHIQGNDQKHFIAD